MLKAFFNRALVFATFQVSSLPLLDKLDPSNKRGSGVRGSSCTVTRC